MLNEKTESGLPGIIEAFISNCRAKNLKVSIKKSTFFSESVRWCGRVIDEEGVQFDTTSISSLNVAELPKSAAELCEFVHCMQWMESSIPDFVERVAPVKEVLEEAYRRAGARSKKAIQKSSLAWLSWNDSHVQEYI